MALFRRFLNRVPITDDAQKAAIWREMRDIERRIEVVDDRIDVELASHVKRLH